ncbi:hypothetical protein [Mycobacterium asiaticum]|uniref:hypothetical protein n=1 Tax=Mycobacterium asiaticum TaxID=1790 RepID=UPI0005669182|nr:hypothetical protein [Mycobacterium asiaticum]ORA12611.1 hypothetical protein BST16_16840 [Mycobacterium asiaticum DSM 44297]
MSGDGVGPSEREEPGAIPDTGSNHKSAGTTHTDQPKGATAVRELCGGADPLAGVFPGQVAQDLWRERWCGTCHQPDEATRRVLDHGPGCPILAQALKGTVPPEWRRYHSHRHRHDAGDLYRCGGYLDRPPVYRRPRAKAKGVQEALFDTPQPQQRLLVEVEGWPDYAVLARNAAEPPGAA